MHQDLGNGYFRETTGNFSYTGWAPPKPGAKPIERTEVPAAKPVSSMPDIGAETVGYGVAATAVIIILGKKYKSLVDYFRGC